MSRFGFCFGVAIAALWVFHRLRVEKIAAKMKAAFEERTRLTRELNDSLYQTLQGAKLVVDDALDDNSSDSSQRRRVLAKLSEWLGQATQDVRSALHVLRATETEELDLAGILQKAALEYLPTDSLELIFSTEGTVRKLNVAVQNEVLLIGFEAIRNACIHSGGDRLEVQTRYTKDFTLYVHDNGRGISANLTAREEAQPECFGIKQMRERAARIHGNLELSGSGRSGTEVVLIVPGTIAFLSNSYIKL